MNTFIDNRKQKLLDNIKYYELIQRRKMLAFEMMG